MKDKDSTNTQFIGLIGTSMYTGVMLCIGVGLGGYWLTVEPQVYAEMFQNIFPFLLPCIALTLLPGFIATFKSFREETNEIKKRLWQNSLIAVVVSIAITTFIAVPLNFKIWDNDTPSSQIEALLIAWLIMHAIRLTAASIGVIYAKKAISRV